MFTRKSRGIGETRDTEELQAALRRAVVQLPEQSLTIADLRVEPPNIIARDVRTRSVLEYRGVLVEAAIRADSNRYLAVPQVG